MTRDDIIKLMQQACDPDKKPAWHNEFWTITQEELERFAALVAEAEREECAKVCLKTEPFYGQMFSEAIRARGNT